jgi:hypothetical protein
MAWTYQQLTGNFLDPDGNLQGKGYSGQPPRVNDPTAQNIEDVGPIPQGLWQAVELIPESSTHGPFAIRLEPYSTTQTFGRSGFLVHGERVNPPFGFASDGCIILSRDIRELFWSSQDHDLKVISGVPQ